MTNKELQQILLLLREQATDNPYFVFVYNWGIVNTSGRLVTAAEVMHCIDMAQFPPIGKN